MAHDDRMSHLVCEAQERMFRLAERDEGLTLKAIGLDSGIPYSTLRSYAGHSGAPAIMSLVNVLKLRGVVPDRLLSLLTEPVSAVICPAPDDWCPDRHAETCNAYQREYNRARHPDSPGGIEIIDSEHCDLKRAANA